MNTRLLVTERTHAARLTERRQIQILQRRMVAGTITVGDGPLHLAFVEIDRDKPAVRRLEQGQSLWSCRPLIPVTDQDGVGTWWRRNECGGDRRVRRRHVQDVRLRIEGRPGQFVPPYVPGMWSDAFLPAPCPGRRSR